MCRNFFISSVGPIIFLFDYDDYYKIKQDSYLEIQL